MEVNKIYQGDCLKVLKTFPNNCIDTIITDPPYGLEFMGKEWDNPKAMAGQIAHNENMRGAFAYGGTHTRGYAAVDLYLYQEWTRQWAKEVLRVAKPGATLLCFGGTRTWHRLACGLEDAGWILKDTLCWLYASGFPKSLNIAKQFLKIGYIEGAKEWEGWGTALKPAWEPIIMAMKPNEGSYAENALKWGVAGLNIEGGRISTNEDLSIERKGDKKLDTQNRGWGFKAVVEENQGRFPANVILECICDEVIEGKEEKEPYSYKGKSYQVKGFIKNNKPQSPSNYYNDIKSGVIHTNSECPCYMLDKQSGVRKAGGNINNRPMRFMNGTKEWGKINWSGFQDIGGASRFFYVAKASKNERNIGGVINNHPTVKPLRLCEYLCRLTSTPTGGIVLDPFAGSGTICMAAKKIGRNYIGIEKEPEYVEIARKRIDAIPDLLI